MKIYAMGERVKIVKYFFTFVLISIIGIHLLIDSSSKNSNKLDSKIITTLILTKSKISIKSKEQQPNLLCIILTSKKSIFERGPAVWDTWSQKCNKTMFSLNSNDLTQNITETNLKFLNKINILNLPLNESYDKMAEKVILTLKLMYELNDNTTKFNWFLFVDDDEQICFIQEVLVSLVLLSDGPWNKRLECIFDLFK